MDLVAVWYPAPGIISINRRGDKCAGITRPAVSWPKARQACRNYLQGIDATIELSDQLGRWIETTSSSSNVWDKVSS